MFFEVIALHGVVACEPPGVLALEGPDSSKPKFVEVGT